jgi:acetolactate synthase-1/2/3 large subunit
MYAKTGAEIIIQLIERQGVSVVAGIPGGANLPLYDALASSRIRHVLARHEQGAAFMAQGIARSTGEAGVCFATSGPGATNLLTAIADAKLDSVPIVCITAQVPRSMIGTEAFQETDICGMAAPATKATFAVRSAAELLDVVPQAFSIALSGRPGPVLIDVPKDVQREMAEFVTWPEPGCAAAHPPVDSRAIERAAELINAAERPVFVLGGGARASGGAWRIRRAAESASIPMAMTLMGLGSIRHDHPLSLGMLGMHGSRAANLATRKSDLVIVMGARLSDRTTGRVAGFCPQAKLIHVNIDAAEFGKIMRPDVAIAADVADVMEHLESRIAPARRKQWRSQTTKLSRPRPQREAAPADAMHRAASLAGESAVVVTDVGQHQMWTAQSYPHTPEGAWLTSGGLGTMGFGLPAAIGAALADPDRPVLCFTGDGSLMMNLQELATAAEQHANVKIVLFDNRGLGLVRQQQKLFYEGRTPESDFRASTDFARLAEAMGVRAIDSEATGDVDGALRAAIAHDGPAMVRIGIASEHQVFPMVPPGAANAEMLQHKRAPRARA